MPESFLKTRSKVQEVTLRDIFIALQKFSRTCTPAVLWVEMNWDSERYQRRFSDSYVGYSRLTRRTSVLRTSHKYRNTTKQESSTNALKCLSFENKKKKQHWEQFEQREMWASSLDTIPWHLDTTGRSSLLHISDPASCKIQLLTKVKPHKQSSQIFHPS
jgi:hypothetical protein